MTRTKFALALAAAGLLAVSCAKDTNTHLNEGGSIDFTASPQDAFTRGLPIDAATDIPDMGVLAYYTGNGAANNWAAQGAMAAPTFMNNIEVTNSGGVWSYANPLYWPYAADANVSFFAYSPYAETANGVTVNITTGLPTITYNVPTDCSNQPDLMISALMADRNKTNTGASPVSLAMNHTLTSIGFKASGNGQQITKIKITGVKTSGILTPADNGTFTWDISAATSGDFEATVNSGVYLDPNIRLVNSGGGFLMMIPQTLPVGATLVVGVDDDRPDVVFDIGGLVWAAGQRINYTLTVEPEAILLLTPDKIVLPPTGGFSQFNAIVENGSSLAWVIAPSETYIYICDNLTHLQEWAAGTRTAANVQNLDASTPTGGGTYAGNGSKTLYVWIPSTNPFATLDRLGNMSQNGNPASLVEVVQLPNTLPLGITNTLIPTSFVGAFWRTTQTGERIIRIPITDPANAGDWSASVAWTDGSWRSGDIVFSTAESDDAGVTYNAATETPADMLNPTNDNTYKVDGYVSSAAATVVSGAGNYIYFRVGLTSTYTPTIPLPARYAVVLLRYGTPQKSHLIFLRQGEEADVLATSDAATGNSAPKWGVYNLGATIGTFAAYPSQAGYFKRWAIPTTLYPPVGTVSWPAETTTNIVNVCPAGYVIPNTNQGASLITGTAPDLRLLGGYYADGFSDRRAIVGSAVSASSVNVAYVGRVLYNRVTNASVFLTSAGARGSSAGALSGQGLYGQYWTSSTAADPTHATQLQYLFGTTSLQSTTARGSGQSIRCVKP